MARFSSPFARDAGYQRHTESPKEEVPVSKNRLPGTGTARPAQSDSLCLLLDIKTVDGIFHSLLFNLSFIVHCHSLSLKMSGIDASNVKITLSENQKQLLDNDKLVFGQSFTDHMLTIEWTEEKGWDTAEIKPYGPLVLDPSCCVFHYAYE